MKTKLLLPLILLVCATCTARAHLIDLTPGGFTFPPPGDLGRIYGIHHLAGANINGNQVIWSPSEQFGSDEFSIMTNGLNASLSWNLTATEGYFLQYVLVEGQFRSHFYQALGRDVREGSSPFVTIDKLSNIQGIIFFGTNIVPDTGATLLLFGFALATFSVWKQQSRGLKGAG